MTTKTRVLIVDDSVVVRRLLSTIIGADPDLEVMGTAPGARLALTKLEANTADVVTLDIEMPDMNGIEALTAIRKLRPDVPVLMCSGLTEKGAVATLEALAHGAADYITKPNSAEGGLDRAAFSADLIAKIKALSRRRVQPTVAPPARPRPMVKPPQALGARRVDIVAIGVSTGGPNALAQMIAELPATLAVPVVIVQHMPPLFTRMLAERLTKVSHVPCFEASHGMAIKPGAVYIAPGDHHMVLEAAPEGTRVALHKGPPENSCRPAVDVLFRSVAERYGPRALGVIMTGMGQDGLRGCEALRATGSRVIVQDQATSVVWGMPGFVAQAGLAEEVLPLELISAAIIRRVDEGRRQRQAS